MSSEIVLFGLLGGSLVLTGAMIWLMGIGGGRPW